MTASGAVSWRTCPRFASPAADLPWSRARDQRFARFLVRRLADVELFGCTAERSAVAGLEDVFEEWLALREAAVTEDSLVNSPVIDVLGWVLRQVAYGAWSRHPQWELGFHPAASGAPINPLQQAPQGDR